MVSNSGNLLIELRIKRRPTPREREESVHQMNEKCLPHVTAVGMVVVSAFWDYMMDWKGDQLGEWYNSKTGLMHKSKSTKTIFAFDKKFFAVTSLFSLKFILK